MDAIFVLLWLLFLIIGCCFVMFRAWLANKEHERNLKEQIPKVSESIMAQE